MSNRKPKNIKVDVEPSSQNWFEGTTTKITTIGGAMLVLISVGGASYQVGRTFMDNEKKLEIFDLKVRHQSEKDSLITQIKNYREELRILNKRNVK